MLVAFIAFPQFFLIVPFSFVFFFDVFVFRKIVFFIGKEELFKKKVPYFYAEFVIYARNVNFKRRI